MKYDFDVIVIGSGFGGSVMTCRLSEKGFKVCLLERGKEYKMHEFPRRIKEVKERMFWDPRDKKHGFMEFRNYPESDVMSVTASGLGGGSLIYANVLIPMPKEYFNDWPEEINRETLDPFYDIALDMLEASPYPLNDNGYYQDTPKAQNFKDVASRVNTTEDMIQDPEFILPNLAIRFKGDFPGHQTINKHGALQSSCNKCGECDIGCNIHAKNTLDLNYIFVAKKHNAEVRTNSHVIKFKKIDESKGYEVTYQDLSNNSSEVVITCEKLILSAGSIGSTALLLKMKKDGYLQNISDRLGKGWCGNGDLEGTVLETGKDLEPTKGPVITSSIQYKYKPYEDGFEHGSYIQDAGFPVGWAWYLIGKGPSPTSFIETFKFGLIFTYNFIKGKLGLSSNQSSINIGAESARMLDNDSWIRQSYMLLGMGRDRSDGEIELREDGEPIIKWNMKRSELHYNRIRNGMKDISDKANGKFLENPLSLIDKIVAVHPLGGCCLGTDASNGVVSIDGEVFGHEDLYVVDGSILPSSVGPNPSLTIAAVAEYIASKFTKR